MFASLFGNLQPCTKIIIAETASKFSRIFVLIFIVSECLGG